MSDYFNYFTMYCVSGVVRVSTLLAHSSVGTFNIATTFCDFMNVSTTISAAAYTCSARSP